MEGGGSANTHEQQAARASAKILERQADGEFRSESYSALLERMLSEGHVPKTPVATRLEDEQSSLPSLATEIICDLAEDPHNNEIEIADLYDTLTRRAARLASDGRFDTLHRIIRLATATSRRCSTAANRKAAHALLEIADREHWLADALARCPSALILNEQVAMHRQRGGDPIDFLLEVARRTRTSTARSAVLEASRDVPALDLVDRCISLANADPGDGLRLAFLVAEHDDRRLSELLRSALLAQGSTQREHAYRLLERLGGAWPKDLVIRALSDENVDIRLLGAKASMPHNASLLVERLRGDIGGSPPGPDETAAIARILRQDASDHLTNDVACSTLRRLAFSLRSDAIRPLVYALQTREGTRLSRFTVQAARLRLGPSKTDHDHRAWARRSAA